MTYILGLVLSLAAVVGLSYVITGRFADTSVLYRQIAESGISTIDSYVSSDHSTSIKSVSIKFVSEKNMKLRKSDFTGTGKVFRFTLVQMLKGKANIITMLIFFL